VLIGVAVLLAFVAARACGGRLTRLVDLPLRGVRVVAAAFAVQILIVNVVPGLAPHGAHAAVHVATYVAIGAAVAVNLRLPGMPLIALGGLSNAAAIVANGGVMPASEEALRTAGMAATTDGFTNSAHVAGAHLAFLGDVFAVPAWVPAANVFSVGDLLLIAGGWVLVLAVTGARAPWRRAGGPAVVLFDAAGVVEAVTPRAAALLHGAGGRGVRSGLGFVLPPEVFVVAGRARTRAGDAEAQLLSRAGRPLRLSAARLEDGARVALTVSAR
jgi:hypothetical protein